MAHTFERPELADLNDSEADKLPLLADWSQKIVHQTQAASGDMENRGILPTLAIGEENRPVLADNQDFAGQMDRYGNTQRRAGEGSTMAPRYGRLPDSQDRQIHFPPYQALEGAGQSPHQAPVEHGLQPPPDGMHRRTKR